MTERTKVDGIEMLVRLIDSRLARLYTIEVGEVLSYDHKAVAARVQLQQRRRKGSGELMEPTEIPAAPAWRWQVGPFYAHVPLQRGDTVLVGFLDRDGSKWHREGGIVTPTPKRAFDPNDGVILGPLTVLSELADAALRDPDDITAGTTSGSLALRASPDGDLEVTGAGDMILGAVLNAGARLELGSGKVRLGTAAVDAIAELEQDVAKTAQALLQLSTATTVTALGAQPLSAAAGLTTIYGQLTAIRAKLLTIKK